jgi:hypothetical protein
MKCPDNGVDQIIVPGILAGDNSTENFPSLPTLGISHHHAAWLGQDRTRPRPMSSCTSTCRAPAARRRRVWKIDKLPNGRYRATVGTLFEHQEICRTGDLEALVRQANAMASCRSFDDVVRAKVLRTLARLDEERSR